MAKQEVQKSQLRVTQYEDPVHVRLALNSSMLLIAWSFLFISQIHARLHSRETCLHEIQRQHYMN